MRRGVVQSLIACSRLLAANESQSGQGLAPVSKLRANLLCSYHQFSHRFLSTIFLARGVG